MCPNIRFKYLVSVKTNYSYDEFKFNLVRQIFSILLFILNHLLKRQNTITKDILM